MGELTAGICALTLNKLTTNTVRSKACEKAKSSLLRPWGKDNTRKWCPQTVVTPTGSRMSIPVPHGPIQTTMKLITICDKGWYMNRLVNFIYSTISSSRIGNRRTQYWRNKSFVCCCPWQTPLIHTRTNTALPLNNSTGHSFSTLHYPTRYTWYAPSDMYSDIYPVIYQQFYRTRSLWITYIESDVCIHASNKI